MPGHTIPHDRERRASDRIRIQLAVSIHIPADGHGPARVLTGELVDIARDGRGAAILIALGQSVPLGGPIHMRFATGDDVPGIVVSRLGLKRCSRLGVRVDATGHGRMRALLVDP